MVDFRGREPYEYRQRNHQIAVIPPFNTVEIAFDLKLRPKAKQDLIKIPFLTIEGSSTRLVFYVNGCGEFEIMHHDQKLNEMHQYTQLLTYDLFYPRCVSVPMFYRYHIIIRDDAHDKAKITAIIDEILVSGSVDRRICAGNETMNVWLDREGSGTNGTMRNLVIRIV